LIFLIYFEHIFILGSAIHRWEQGVYIRFAPTTLRNELSKTAETYNECAKSHAIIKSPLDE